MPVVATGVVVDAIAVANVEALLGAIPPDRALHEPRKRCREGRIELASINARRQQPEPGIFAGLENGSLRPVVGKELPLADASRAHKEILEPGSAGKIVLIC